MGSVPPDVFCGVSDNYADGVVVTKAEQEAAAFSAQFEQSRQQKIDSVNVEKSTKLFSDVAAVFPVGERVIQFRDPGDQMALTNVVQGAMVNVMSGNPTAEAKFITADNVTQLLTAQEMVVIGMTAGHYNWHTDMGRV